MIKLIKEVIVFILAVVLLVVVGGGCVFLIGAIAHTWMGVPVAILMLIGAIALLWYLTEDPEFFEFMPCFKLIGWVMFVNSGGLRKLSDDKNNKKEEELE